MTIRLRFGSLAVSVLALAAGAVAPGCKPASDAVALMDALACAEGDKEVCRERFEAHRARCDDGDAHACVLHAIEHENERVVPADDAKAAVLYARACELGSGDGCWYAGSRHASGRGVPKDEVRALALYGEACKKGSVNGCYDLGSAREQGRGAPADPAAALAAYERACTLSGKAGGSGCEPARLLREKRATTP